MDKESFFLSLFVIWYMSNFGYKGLIPFVRVFYEKADKFISYCNNMISPDIFSDDDEEEEQKQEQEEKPVIKYEDKYLTEIRKMNKEFVLNQEQQYLKVIKFKEFQEQIEYDYKKKIEKYEIQLFEIEEKIKETNFYDEEYCLYNEEDINYDRNINYEYGETKEEILKNLTNEKNKINEKLTNLKTYIESKKFENEIKEEASTLTEDFIVNNILDKLKNSYIIEYTPLGNVLMIYDNLKKTFVYYSDNTIPYRYLEPVARKYVKIYNCRPIFVDMEEELKIAEEKWEKERIEKEQKEEENKRKAEELKRSGVNHENKKNVFAKFKSYNKDTTSSKTMVAPPKNSIPNKNLTKEQENEKVLLKERANRYRYEGKISNFSFIQKVKRNVVDKKYAMTFSDFKRMKIVL